MGLFYDIASYVHRIAGGAKPSEMPIEQSPRFYMAVNLKTAASLGVPLPEGLEARRDRGSDLDAQRFGARDQLLRIGNIAGVILFITSAAA
jgi:ABC-type uncharacterized transport system substrate-binding protein